MSAYNDDLNERFKARMDTLKLTLPENSNLYFVDRYSDSMNIVINVDAGRQYGGEASWESLPLLENMDDKTIRQIVSHVIKVDKNWKQVASIDYALGLTGYGRPLMDVGFDEAFLNWCALHGVTSDDLIELLRKWTKYQVGCCPNDILIAIRTSYSNLGVEDISHFFGSRYRNMTVTRDPIAYRLGHFQGSIWGKKAFAFDFMIGENIYTSSNTPNLTLTADLPDAYLSTLKGRLLNSLVDKPIFGEDQKVIHARREKGKIKIVVDSKIVPLSPIRSNDLRLAA